MHADVRLTFVLYGIAFTTNRKEWLFHNGLQWWRNMALRPTKAWVKGEQFAKRTTSFTAAEKSIQEHGLAKAVVLSMVVMKKNGKDVLLDAVSEIGFDEKAGFACFEIEEALSGDGSACAFFLEECIAELRPEYGVGFSMDVKYGGLFYAIGIDYGETPGGGYRRPEIDQSWRNEGMDDRVWRRGIIRDVYPVNVLSRAHLAFPIGTRTFADWIESDASRGRLRQVDATDCWIWNVENEMIDHLYGQLFSCGMIFGSKE